MDRKKVLNTAGKIIAVIGVVGGYGLVRSRMRCPQCGSWKTRLDETLDVGSGKVIGGIYIDGFIVKKTVRICKNGHPICTVREEIK